MLLSIAAAALALQAGLPLPSHLETPRHVAEPIQYRAYAHPPPCGHGFDLSARDGLCYPNGFLAPQDQAARQYQYRGYRGRGDSYPRPQRRYYYDY